MSRGMTIADFVQQVFYAMYRVRLDVDASKEGSFHSKSDKFKEIVMEANFMLQEFQKEQDWNFLRERWDIGFTHPGFQEFRIPEGVYRICTGYNDAVRMHMGHGVTIHIPFVSPRSGNMDVYEMYDENGFLNVDKRQQRAFVVGDTLAFYRPWFHGEIGRHLETDVISYIEPLHICNDDCPDNCPKAYEDIHFRWMPDPYYFVVKTAARRAIADPSLSEMVQTLTDEAAKMLSAVRENDSAHTYLDTYETAPIGFISVL